MTEYWMMLIEAWLKILIICCNVTINMKMHHTHGM